jgi:Transposase IS4
LKVQTFSLTLHQIKTRARKIVQMKTLVCVDESMAPYFGRHGAKQFIRGKPVRFGYKFWCLCDCLGYLIQFEPYQSHQYDKDLGLGASVVQDLMAELPTGIPFKLYGDRFFTSLKLVDCLHSRGYGYTGTVMSNRMEGCPITGSKVLVKQQRGSIDYKLDAESRSIVVAWNDNRPVYMISSVHGVNPIGSCMRWVSAEKKKISLQVPDAVVKYNMYMGGVDRMDQNISNYRIGVRSKKWWWPVFVFCIETSVHNAWQLYRKTEEGTKHSMDLLEFRRTIVKIYLMKYAIDPKTPGRPKKQ